MKKTVSSKVLVFSLKAILFLHFAIIVSTGLNVVMVLTSIRPILEVIENDLFKFGPYLIQFNDLLDLCLEKRAFYRAISGFHTSINIHLCAEFLHGRKIVFHLFARFEFIDCKLN